MESNYLERFLPYFLSSRFPHEKIYVADNASTDGSVKWLKTNFPQIECITLEKNAGYAGGYNEALSRIKAKYYALVNSDVEITPQWLHPIIEMMEKDPTIAAVQPKILSESAVGVILSMLVLPEDLWTPWAIPFAEDVSCSRSSAIPASMKPRCLYSGLPVLP